MERGEDLLCSNIQVLQQLRFLCQRDYNIKEKKRTPAWCDRILWCGDGIEQLYYIRGESWFSDHRPVCAVFSGEVGVLDGRSNKGLANSNMKVEVEELLPPSTSSGRQYRGLLCRGSRLTKKKD